MTNTSTQNKVIQLLAVKDGKYHVKIENVDIPVSIDENLYKKWVIKED